MSLLICKTLRVASAITGLSAAILAEAAISGQGTWESELLARSGYGHPVALSDPSAEFFYNSTMNITIPKNFNLSGIGMNWYFANIWAADLSIDVGGRIVSDWRLPTIIDTAGPGCDHPIGAVDCGYNVPTQVNGKYSEFSYLYHVTLGNQPGFSVNTAYFDNITPGNYWSGTGTNGQYSTWAFSFNLRTGHQEVYGVGDPYYIIPIRDGDILTAVPEPNQMFMALLGLAALGGFVRKQHVVV